MLSAFSLGVSYHALEMIDYTLFEHWFNIREPFGIILSYVTWILSLFVTIYFCWVSLRRITVDYKYHFRYWLLIMVLLILPFVFNRGWYWFQIGFFFGLPAVGLNYLLNGIKYSSLKRHKIFSYIIFTAVFLAGGYGEYQATNSSSLITERYDIEVNCYTIPTFLDWQIELELEICDKHTDEDYDFELWFGNGPYFQICEDLKSDSIFFIQGLKSNRGLDWTIDFKSEDVFQHGSFEEVSVKILAVHDSDFILRKFD